MAGHSKWANIQHRKKAQDAKRGKLFTKLIREITVAARAGGGDLDTNPRLRLAVDKALAGNMTKDTIERAVKRGAGAMDGDDYEEIRYEGYGPGGSAVIVDCMTDNRNRTVAEVRHAFTKCGGNLGTSGSVAFQFTHCGVITLPPGADEERVMELALEAGADDVVTNEDSSIEVITPPDQCGAVRDALQGGGLELAEVEVTMRPNSTTGMEEEDGRKVLRLLDMLEELDDVQSVYSNADLPEELFE
jgi:YebC/PmpR family DNA-binding regulatory protein